MFSSIICHRSTFLSNLYQINFISLFLAAKWAISHGYLIIPVTLLTGEMILLVAKLRKYIQQLLKLQELCMIMSLSLQFKCRLIQLNLPLAPYVHVLVWIECSLSSLTTLTKHLMHILIFISLSILYSSRSSAASKLIHHAGILF